MLRSIRYRPSAILKIPLSIPRSNETPALPETVTIADVNKVKVFPDNADIYNLRELAYFKAGQYDKAIEDYNKAITLKPDYMDAYYSRGVAYVRKASSDFSRACEKGNKFACDNLKQISQ